MTTNTTTPTTATTTPTGTQTYQGGCHCGAVRYEVQLDLSKGGTKCNCSICRRTGFFGTIAKPADFRLLKGEESLGDYQFGTMSGHHWFCKHCGVRSFGSGELEMLGGHYYSINLLCLDDVHLTDVPVLYWDGKNNNWMAGPAPTPYDGGPR